MKRILILLSLAVSSVTFAHAQSFSINPEIGANLSSFHHSDNIQNMKENLVGLKAGLSFNVGLSKHFHIQPGVFLDMKNAEFKGTENGMVFEKDFSMNYVTVPVNLYIQIPFIIGKIFLTGGPYLGLGLSGEHKLSINGIQQEYDKSIFGADKDQLNKLDYGFNFGAGYKTPIGIYGRVQYGLGMGNLSNSSSYDIEHRTWQISVGWSIGFGS